MLYRYSQIFAISSKDVITNVLLLSDTKRDANDHLKCKTRKNAGLNLTCANGPSQNFRAESCIHLQTVRHVITSHRLWQKTLLFWIFAAPSFNRKLPTISFTQLFVDCRWIPAWLWSVVGI